MCHFAVEDSCVAEESVSIPLELANWIKFNAKHLKIRQTERQWAAELVNNFRENLLKFLKSNDDQPFFQSAEFLMSGSYFEKVKVSHDPSDKKTIPILTLDQIYSNK